MLEYVERHFNTYIKDTDLKDNALNENPVRKLDYRLFLSYSTREEVI